MSGDLSNLRSSSCCVGGLANWQPVRRQEDGFSCAGHTPRDILHRPTTSVAPLIGHLRSSTFRLSATAMSMSLTGSRFSGHGLGAFLNGLGMFCRGDDRGSPAEASAVQSQLMHDVACAEDARG